MFIEYGKLFTAPLNNSIQLEDHDAIVAQCKIKLAGHIAEELLLGSCGYSYHPEDNGYALNIAKYICSNYPLFRFRNIE